jgi:hypothetical protein
VSWQPYAMVILAVLVLGALLSALALAGFDSGAIVGAGIGLGAALLLMAFNVWNTRRALREQQRKAAMGHVIGGFALRLVVLAVGFFALAFSGVASPVTFALAFLGGVMLMLGWQVVAVSRDVARRANAAA